MKVEPVTHRILEGPPESRYVYQAPVRIAHWLFALSIPVLAASGYLIGSPLPSIGGEASDSFLMGWIRTVHFSAAWVFAVTFAWRLYWVAAGNSHARGVFLPPLFNGRWWRGVGTQAAYYLFLRREPELWLGHNPLAQLAMFLMFVLGSVFMILTGFALYSQQWGWGDLPMDLFGWVFVLFGDPQTVRTLHAFGMWYILVFVIVHLYMVLREEIMGDLSMIGAMVSGVRMFKRGPRG